VLSRLAVRNLLLNHTDQLTGARALVRDRGSQFVDSFDEVFRTEGLKILRTPVRTPVANTFAERWIGSIRRELLKQPEGLPRTHHLEPATARAARVGYIDHYNEHRPHQSLGQRPPIPVDHPPESPPATVAAIRTSRCDGLINEYRNAA
jgi:transposase InsO family protein